MKGARLHELQEHNDAIGTVRRGSASEWKVGNSMTNDGDEYARNEGHLHGKKPAGFYPLQ